MKINQEKSGGGGNCPPCPSSAAPGNSWYVLIINWIKTYYIDQYYMGLRIAGDNLYILTTLEFPKHNHDFHLIRSRCRSPQSLSKRAVFSIEATSSWKINVHCSCCTISVARCLQAKLTKQELLHRDQKYPSYLQRQNLKKMWIILIKVTQLKKPTCPAQNTSLSAKFWPLLLSL